MTGQYFPYVSNLSVNTGSATFFTLPDYESVITRTGEQTYGNGSGSFTVIETERVPNMEPIYQQVYDIKILLLFLVFIAYTAFFYKIILPYGKRFLDSLKR